MVVLWVVSLGISKDHDLPIMVNAAGSTTTTTTTKAKQTRSTDRSIQVINDSPSRIDIYWVNPDTREEISMSSSVLPGTDFSMNSYVGHEFAARERPTKDGICPHGLENDQETKQTNHVAKNTKDDTTTGCRVTNFVVSENDEQVVRITSNFTTIFEDTKVKASQQAEQLIQSCQTKAQEQLTKANNANPKLQRKIMDELVTCVEQGVANALEQVHEEIAFQSQVRTSISARLENYTCVDDSMESTPDVRTSTWVAPNLQETLTVHIKHDRPASQIHVIENFIQPKECLAMEQAAAQRLHRATVADGKGGSQLSENRKAMQAGIRVAWDREAAGDPIARLSRRVYDYTNHVLGLDIREEGQEDLMSIQYQGRGLDDKTPDQYTPHCDGDCNGLPHKFGQRMATMVMYCTVADRGGHTNFRNAGVHVKPQPGDAVFFSYIDPEKKVMDTGFTEHSGCPVFEGNKKIVTQWIRYGVDSVNTWDSFNTLGIKKSEIDREYDYDEEGEEEYYDDEDDYDSEDDEEGGAEYHSGAVDHSEL